MGYVSSLTEETVLLKTSADLLMRKNHNVTLMDTAETPTADFSTQSKPSQLQLDHHRLQLDPQSLLFYTGEDSRTIPSRDIMEELREVKD